MEYYKVHNTVRALHTRTQRMAAPTAPRFKQHVGGTFRVLRGRPLVLSAEELATHIEELKAKVADGLLEVRTMDGRVVDLETMVADTVPPPVPQPSPPLDSAKNDLPFVGEKMPQMAGGVPIVDQGPMGDAAGGIPGPMTSRTAEEAALVNNEDPAGESHHRGRKGKR